MAVGDTVANDRCQREQVLQLPLLARTASQNLVADLPGSGLWMMSASPAGSHKPRTAKTTRGVSRASGTWHAERPFSILFDPFRDGCAQLNSRSWACDGTPPAAEDPKVDCMKSSNVVPSVCSLHGAPVAKHEIRAYGDCSMARAALIMQEKPVCRAKLTAQL